MVFNSRLTRRATLRTGAAATGLFGLGTRLGTARSNESSSADYCYYQVDFVEGDPIETLGKTENAYYGRQNRLIQYVHGTGDAVVERDTWINSLDPAVRRCVTADPIRVGDDTASVEFRVEEGCERTLSLAVYSLPGGEFSFDEEQELADAATGTFGPGTHDLAVDLSSVGCPQSSNGYDQVAKLVDDDGEWGDWFGVSVAVSDSGDTAVVAVPGDEGADVESGSVRVFERTDGRWSQRAKLTAADTVEGDEFGGPVAVSGSGDTAVVGAPDDGDDDRGLYAGAAYVFGRTDGTWSQRAKLTAADAAATDNLGHAVAVSGSGDTAVAGAPFNGGGSAYVFGRTDGAWGQQAKLTTAAESAGEFGHSVAVSGPGNTVIAGDPTGDGAVRTSGSAYAFVWEDETWTQRANLTADDPSFGDALGHSVAVSGSGDTAVAGAPEDDHSGEDDVGSAYVFET